MSEKCPLCGNELTPISNDENILRCTHCKKAFLNGGEEYEKCCEELMDTENWYTEEDGELVRYVW